MDSNAEIEILIYSCRACLSKESSEALHSLTDDCVCTLFATCTSILIVEDEGLPMHICSECFEKCKAWKAFKESCQATEAALRSAMLVDSKCAPTEYESPDELEEQIIQHCSDTNSIQGDIELIEMSDCEQKNDLSSMEATIYSCHICYANFQTKTGLNNHMFLHSDKSFPCKDCDNAYATPRSLANHRHRDHSQKVAYCCEICGKESKTHQGFSVHLKSHSEEKPFSCDQCGIKFKYKYNLLKHERRHKGIKSFACPECEVSFYSQSELNNHSKRRHTNIRPHSCTICSKGFLNASLLKIHSRKHSGEKPYQCDICRNQFSSSNGLKEHKLTHTGEKPHQCSICSAFFRKKTTLITHLKTHKSQ